MQNFERFYNFLKHIYHYDAMKANFVFHETLQVCQNAFMISL